MKTKPSIVCSLMILCLVVWPALAQKRASTAKGQATPVGEPEKTFKATLEYIDKETGKGIEGPDLDSRKLLRKGEPATYSMSMNLLEGLLPGNYVLRILAGEYFETNTAVTISNRDLSKVEVKLKKIPSMSGSVVIEDSKDQSLVAKLTETKIWLHPGAQEAMRRSGVKERAPLSLNPDGSFIGPGWGALMPIVEGEEVLKMGGWYLRLERNGTVLPLGYEVKPGEPLNNFRLVFGYGTASLRGQINLTGVPLPSGVKVYLRASRDAGASSDETDKGEMNWKKEREMSDRQATVLTVECPVDSQGRFVLNHLLTGKYILRLVLKGSGLIFLKEGYPMNTITTPGLVERSGDGKDGILEIAPEDSEVMVENGKETPLTLELKLEKEEIEPSRQPASKRRKKP